MFRFKWAIQLYWTQKENHYKTSRTADLALFYFQLALPVSKMADAFIHMYTRPIKIDRQMGGKARGNVALIIMYINIEHHILITLLTQNKQTYNRCSAQLRTPMQTFSKTSMTSKRTTDSSARKWFLKNRHGFSTIYTVLQVNIPFTFMVNYLFFFF